MTTISTIYEQALAERLKDIAYNLDLRALRATIDTGPDTWTHVRVRHAGLFTDASVGWETTIKHDGL